MVIRRTFLISIALTASAFAQLSSFPKRNYFREVLQQTKTKVELRDPIRLRDFVVSDKLELSLKNYLELVMANNTDVQVAFLSLEQPKNAITSAYSIWDPTATARFSATRTTKLNLTPSVADAGGIGSVQKTLNQPLTVQYSQTLDTGTQYTASFGATKSTSPVVKGYNPLIQTNFSFQATQPLLKGRGRYINRIPLMQAQGRLKISEIGLRSTLITIVSNAENAYWNVISARENLKVQEKALDATKQNYDFVKKQLDLGAISELDIYNPEGQLANSELQVASARFRLATALDSLRRQMGVDLDPEVRKLDIVLTEPVDINTDALAFDPEREVEKALATVPQLKSALQTLDLDDLSIQSAKNGLLPSLNFTASYSNNGQGGEYLDGPQVYPGGLYDSFSSLFGFHNPSYVGSLVLTLPIRNRQASMNYANSLIQKKNDALTLRNQGQTVRLNVLNAITNVRGAIEQLKLARKQADLQAKNLEAESRKFELGTQTNQFVVTAIQQKVAADAAVVTNQVSVRTNLLQLLVANGTLLDERGVVIK